MSIEETENEIVEEFEIFGDWMEKYEHIIEIGNSVPKINEKYKDEAHEIKGCQSKVWLHSELKDGHIFYSADSDAIITKGLVGLVIRVFSGHTPEEIINANLSFIDKIGLHEHLSPTRSNGLTAMIKQIKFDALAQQTLATKK
ncbi:MAG TPA: SufE family protein [Bacteroidia bacterium]|jgi:cysteine desulfuration protein SufE|nr:SufE family protein [Bacteroidia bacterium]